MSTNSISNLPKLAIEKSLPTPQNNEVILPIIEWQNQKPISATMSDEDNQTYDKSKARLGTAYNGLSGHLCRLKSDS